MGTHPPAVDKTSLRHSTDRPRPASPDPGSDTHQASKLQVNTDIIQGSTSYDNLDVTKELEASSSNISRLQDGQPDDTQSPQLALAAVSPHQSDLNNHLPKQPCRGATRNDCRKRPRIIAPIKLASTASVALGSSAEPQSRAQITALDQEMVDDRSANGSDHGDYDNMSDAAGSQRGGRPRKRVRRTKDTKDNDVAALPTHSLDTSYQTIVATSSSGILESEEIPIHGYFTLKSIESKVRQGTTTNLGEPQLVAPVADPNHQWGIRKIMDQKMVGRERHYRVEWKDTSDDGEAAEWLYRSLTASALKPGGVTSFD
ncbi:hypothetical protein G7Y89_g14868 [Cudoniella acicularis]|uniref:Chromo domain-containing protein n=1 Tax=Cudoniella acicularis TaxID=354080 RepID=A0A8H4QWU6_9HELO|nr:hypothetical protein G7Y89_g14868 [Cudoniella acicularis]